MTLFEKLPIIIDAEQYTEYGKPVKGMCSQTHFTSGEDEPHVHTIHDQKVYLEIGDWVIPESDGEHFYPCKPVIFEMTYKKVKEEKEKTIAKMLERYDSYQEEMDEKEKTMESMINDMKAKLKEIGG